MAILGVCVLIFNLCTVLLLPVVFYASCYRLFINKKTGKHKHVFRTSMSACNDVNDTLINRFLVLYHY